MIDKETQLWREYESLRSEIRGADSLNYQIMGIVVGAVAALLTTGFKEAEPIIRLLVFLCVYVVTIPGYRLLQGNRRRTWRISTYIRTFLEPQLEFAKWETRLDSQRRRAGEDSTRQYFSSLVGTNEWFIISVMNILAALAAVFSGLLQINTDLSVKAGGVVGIAILNLWLLLVTSRQEKDLRPLGRVEQGFLKSWIEIREAEQQR